MAYFIPLGEQQEDAEAIAAIPTRDKVIGLINEAQVVPKDRKIFCLNQVKELIINKEPELLDSFMDEVIAFQADVLPDVRKFIITFIEEACKKDVGMLLRVVPILAYMMDDQSTIVLKRLLASIIQIYRLALPHIARMKTVDRDTEEMWEVLQDIKQKVCSKIESENDGVRTITIKFMEFLILTQTKKEANSDPSRSDTDISLDIVPLSHPMLNPAELREEAGTTMGALLQITISPVVSSVNLMTCIISLATIAKQRPSYITTVLQAFDLLHANLPPHFVESQVSSVRKQLKTQLLGLLRLSSLECREQITTLLTDLGCTQAEIAKNTPREKRGRGGDADASSASRKMRSGDTSADSGSGKGAGSEGVAGDDKTIASAHMEAIEMTTNDLKPLLTPAIVTELVMLSMKNVPAVQPKSFGSSYTPIAAAGSEPQVMHLARLLASQMTSAGIGAGAEAKGIKPQQGVLDSPTSRDPASSPVVRDPRKRRREEEEEEESDRMTKKIKKETGEDSNLEQSMAELSYLGKLLGLPHVLDPSFHQVYNDIFGGATPPAKAIGEGSVKMETNPIFVQESNLVAIPTTPVDESDEKKKRKLQVIPQKLKPIHKFDLTTLLRPLDSTQRSKMAVAAFKRVLDSEMVYRGANRAKVRLIVSLVTLFGNDFNKTLLEFILEDFRARFDLATAWLFSEYSREEGYLYGAPPPPPPQHGHPHAPSKYTVCLTELMLGAKDKLDPRDRLFSKLVLEAPKVTHEALHIIRSYCQDEERAFLGVSTLRELVLRRPHGPEGTEDFLQALLEVTVSDIELARIQAMHIAKKFYTRPELTMKVERFALQRLQLLLSDHPMFEQTTGDMDVAVEWSEASVKLCFSLFVALLPLNHKLLKDLAFVYTSTMPTVKRTILRQLDQPVRSIGMESVELLQLVEDCPRGGETLILRMLHILTEGAAPSADLVNRVRELYRRNSSDVRFLIPVLHGLQKREVISALPMFVKLSPNLVKGVFDRLLVMHRGVSVSPVSPSELLIALHNIDCTNDESLMKYVIKATNLCFQEKTVFTQEVLASVLQQLLDHDPLPTLFMRTVLQSLGICPKLISFVMTILVKLIQKKVWQIPKVWQGFIKCCELTKPHSYQVLVKLPAQQLEAVLEHNSTMRQQLCNHVQKLPSHQKTTIAHSVMHVLEKSSSSEVKEVKEGKKTKRKRPSSSASESASENQKQPNTTIIDKT